MIKERFYEHIDDLINEINLSLSKSNSMISLNSVLDTFYLLWSIFDSYMKVNSLKLNSTLDKIKKNLLKLGKDLINYLTKEIQNANSKIETKNEITSNIYKNYRTNKWPYRRNQQ